MAEKVKQIGEIFSDYNTNSNIKYAQVKGLNVIKKTNTLQVLLYFDEYIEIKEIWFFEKFLRERFQFQDIDIKINYHEKVEKKAIKDEWKNIIAYMAHKYPLAKPMLLLKSDIEVTENEIKIYMHIKGADFLKAKKADRELQKLINNLFGKEYIIDISEKLSEEDIKQIKEKIEKEEAKLVAYIEENRQNAIEQQVSEQVPEYSDVDYAPPTDLEGYIPEMPNDVELPPVNDEQIKEYILGKSSKAKEKHIKIKDITANDGRVTLEGRVVTVDVKETKSGKGMIVLDLYDGSGTITCKSFSKDLTEGKEIVEKIKNAKAIKLIGKAGLDTYVGDITVIANTIMETTANVPELPKEDEVEDTPLILRNVTKYNRKYSKSTRFRCR